MVKTLSNTQGCPIASHSLPIPSEEFIAIHCSPPVAWVMSPGFCDCKHITVFQLQNSFQLLLFFAHAVCIGVDALHLGYWPHHLFWGGSPNSCVAVEFCWVSLIERPKLKKILPQPWSRDVHRSTTLSPDTARHSLLSTTVFISFFSFLKWVYSNIQWLW